jgi:phage tail P2-like protein
MTNTQPTGIRTAPHIAVFDDVIAARFNAIPVDRVLIYLIDLVHANALPVLAEQFDLLGWKGYRLAETEAEKRALIKRAIELQRTKGTPFAVKRALATIGYDNTELIEQAGRKYNGQSQYDGTTQYGGHNWARFSIIFDIGNDQGITPDQKTALIALVNEYKNARSHLKDVFWKASMVELVQPTEELLITVEYSDVVDEFAGARYNGSIKYNGSNKYQRYPETNTVTILP